MPVGLELLGPVWSEGELIRLAYSYEQRTRHRRPPVTTPPLSTPPPVSEEWLATGAASVPPIDTAVTARARFTWMSATGELRYTASVYGVRGADVLFMDLHRGDAGAVGPVEITLPYLATGDDGPFDYARTLRRSEIEAWTRPVIARLEGQINVLAHLGQIGHSQRGLWNIL